MSWEIRPARPSELSPVAATLRSAGLGANVGRLPEFPHQSPGGDVLAAVHRGEVVGGAAVAGFGPPRSIGALRSPWGLGPSVVAEDADAGLALLSALRRTTPGPLTVSLPDANVTGTRALRAWGLRPINQATRMRLGPAPAYEPGRLFGMFNL